MPCNKDFATIWNERKKSLHEVLFSKFLFNSKFFWFLIQKLNNSLGFPWFTGWLESLSFLQVTKGILVCKIHNFFDKGPQGPPSGFEK